MAQPYTKKAAAPGAMRTTYGEEFFKKVTEKSRVQKKQWEKPSVKFGGVTEYQALAESRNSMIKSFIVPNF